MIPAIVVQIIFGIILGAGVFSINTNGFGVAFLSNFGLFVIFYQVGMDFDLAAPELTSTSPARSAVAGVSTSLVLVLLAMLALGHSIESSLLVGLATVSTSVSVSVYSFLALGPLSHLEAKVAVMAGLFDDLLGLSALAVLSSVLSKSLDGMVSLIASLLVVAVSYVLQRRLSGKSFELAAARRYLLVAILAAFVILLWHQFGLTLAIAGFVAGAFSGPVLTGADRRFLIKFSGFVAPFFLVSIGLLVKVREGITVPDVLGVVVLSFALILAKGAAAIVIRNQVKDRVLYWFSMVPRAEVAGIGLVLIAPRVSSGIELQAVLAVIVTSIVAPLVIAHRAKQA